MLSSGVSLCHKGGAGGVVAPARPLTSAGVSRLGFHQHRYMRPYRQASVEAMMPGKKPHPTIYVTPNLGIEVVREYPPESGHGYIKCHIRPHPMMTGVVVLRSRLRMTDEIGRKLASTEIVHHKNENRTDDRIENFELTTRADHARHHHTGDKQSPEWVSKKAAGMRLAHKRGAFQNAPRGERSHFAKLTWEDICKIRRLYAGGARLFELAKTYGVKDSNIHAIVNNRSWRKPR